MNNHTRGVPLSFLLTLAALTLGSTAPAQDPEPAAKVMCAVVQVGDEYRIIKADEVDELKKTLKQEHEEAVAAHKEAAKAAKEKKERFDVPAPKAQKLKVVKASIEESEAKALVEKLQAKGEKAGKDKPAKKSEKPAKKEPPAKKEKPGKKGG